MIKSKNLNWGKFDKIMKFLAETSLTESLEEIDVSGTKVTSIDSEMIKDILKGLGYKKNIKIIL